MMTFLKYLLAVALAGGLIGCIVEGRVPMYVLLAFFVAAVASEVQVKLWSRP